MLIQSEETGALQLALQTQVRHGVLGAQEEGAGGRTQVPLQLLQRRVQLGGRL